MIVTVEPCFCWISYHVITGLLNEGYEVIGIDDLNSELNESLYMFVGRNSNFQHFFHRESKEKHVQSDEDELLIRVGCEHIELNGGKNAIHCLLPIPPLYGEWMNVEELGIESLEEFNEWINNQEAISVDVFVKQLMTFILDIETKGKQNNFSFKQEDKSEEYISHVWNFCL